MCDPITIAGVAATVGGTVMNNMAAGRAADARNDVLKAERVRQAGLDREAQALNATSQDRYQGFEGQQGEKAKTLADYFAAPAASTETAGDANGVAGSAMPSATSDIVVQEMAKKSALARQFTDQQAGALADLRSFGELLGDTSRAQVRDASQIGQIGGFKRGSSGIMPLELDAASHAGDGLKTFGDILGGIGSIGTTYGLTRGATPLAKGSVPLPVARPAGLGGVPLPVARPANLLLGS